MFFQKFLRAFCFRSLNENFTIFRIWIPAEILSEIITSFFRDFHQKFFLELLQTIFRGSTSFFFLVFFHEIFLKFVKHFPQELLLRFLLEVFFEYLQKFLLQRNHVFVIEFLKELPLLNCLCNFSRVLRLVLFKSSLRESFSGAPSGTGWIVFFLKKNLPKVPSASPFGVPFKDLHEALSGNVPETLSEKSPGGHNEYFS